MTTDTTFADTEMPASLAEQFQPLLGMAEPPATYGEWVDATVETLTDAGFTLDVDALCLTAESPHRVTIDGEDRYLRCVLDALLVPFVVDDSGPVEVHSRCPVTGTDARMAVTRDGVTATPGEAVVSFGVATDSDLPDDHASSPLRAADRFCPYVNAFADESAYEAWDDETIEAVTTEAVTTEAVTTGLTVAEGFALAELLADHLTEGA